MYREQGNIISERSDRNAYWNKNHFPLGWDKLSPESFGEAVKVANQVWDDTQDETRSIDEGIEAARRYAAEKNVKFFV